MAVRVAPEPAVRVRSRVRVEGTVQGVGFRPFVHRLAHEQQLAGWVRNDARGVLLEVEGAAPAVERFLGLLESGAPPLAIVERVLHERREPSEATGFVIAESDAGARADAPVAADSAPCEACLAELVDPDDRRHRYPFINCTNCGPRFTIVRGIPYDRPLTTMAGFEMCAACLAEYEDPADRRFHAQPNACPDCGPHARLIATDANAGGADAVAAAARLLREGAILAIKGLGGYHLACRADDERTVGTLRRRKQREDKPFALMVSGLEQARALVALTDAGERLLRSRERPIVLAPRRPEADVAASVAPGSPELGVMLAYTPLHALLLSGAGCALVLTSGNVSDEPIAYRDEDALERLATIADAFLVHDRPIETRTDDSVMRVFGDRTTMLRRSRGFVPQSIPLTAAAARPVLACGAELKNTFCLASGRRAWVSHHVGDLRNAETLASFEHGIAHFERLFALTPQVIAHDLHPDYLSTAYALGRDDVELVGVQHHHAHLAACLAEHGEPGPAIGAIYDGAGYAPDGSVWGGELLHGDLHGFERVGHLCAVRLPGGDRAAREPWRMARAWLLAAGIDHDEPPAALLGAVDDAHWAAIGELVRSGFCAPLTTSAGRLFDAVAALCGVRAHTTYEGQAAIELEARADPRERGAYELPVGPRLELDARPVIRAIASEIDAGVPVRTVSARFHNALARATAAACTAAAHAAGTDVVVLSGGVFQNRLLLAETERCLVAERLRVLVPALLPAGDGGISYGQAAIAAARG